MSSTHWETHSKQQVVRTVRIVESYRVISSLFLQRVQALTRKVGSTNPVPASPRSHSCLPTQKKSVPLDKSGVGSKAAANSPLASLRMASLQDGNTMKPLSHDFFRDGLFYTLCIGATTANSWTPMLGRTVGLQVIPQKNTLATSSSLNKWSNNSFKALLSYSFTLGRR